MKITETVTRECCQTRDLKVYSGKQFKDNTRGSHYKFCVHCGQLWTMHRSPGEMDYGFEKVTILTTDI